MTTPFWQLLFGLGIFLYGMSRLEEGLRDISRTRLKRWLIQSTSTPISSASFGVAITTLLQSSSMVSLLVLAFASAGIMPLYNGIGVILGANVGTTATGWLVTLLGFKLDLEVLAIPFFGIGCLSQVLLKAGTRWRAAGKLILGLGLLLYGLSLMKSSVANLPQSWDISLLSEQPAILYLLVGILITAIIQSSSATMMLTLTALHAGLIDLPGAASLVIGADIGTTSTTVLGSLTGSAIKKRLALAHVLFNFIVDIAAFIFLLPFLPELLSWLGISDPLYSLVAFHSCFNLLGLLCFLPFLKPFSRWINQRFDGTETLTHSIQSMPTEVPEAALSAMMKQVNRLWLQALLNNLQHFSLKLTDLGKLSTNQLLVDLSLKNNNAAWQQHYELIKDHEDDLMQFALRLQQEPLDENQAQQLAKLLEVTRSLVYACKTLKDIHQNLQHLQNSDDSAATTLFFLQQQFHRDLYRQFVSLMLEKHAAGYVLEDLANLQTTNDQHYQTMNTRVYSATDYHEKAGNKVLIDGDAQLSTQLNVNREIHHANKSLIQSLHQWLNIMQLSDLSLEPAGYKEIT